MGQPMTKQSVAKQVQDQLDKYAGQEKALREKGHPFLADYLREAQVRLDNVHTQISTAQDPSDIKEAHRQSVAVADDSVEFMVSQMEL